MIGEGYKSGKGGGSSLSKGTWMPARQMEGEKSGVQVGGRVSGKRYMRYPRASQSQAQCPQFQRLDMVTTDDRSLDRNYLNFPCMF